MIRKVRRKDKEIGSDKTISLITNCEYGVLSTIGDDGQPYGVPLNYVYKNNCIFFHCAQTGHKIENIESSPKVSFCVVGDTEVLPSEFSTNYVSAVIFGVASEILGDERYNALEWLLEKYSPEFIKEGKKYIEKFDHLTKVIRIDIQHISGKQAPAKA